MGVSERLSLRVPNSSEAYHTAPTLYSTAKLGHWQSVDDLGNQATKTYRNNDTTDEDFIEPK